jgi:P pilus assembly chaperone PapD
MSFPSFASIPMGGLRQSLRILLTSLLAWLLLVLALPAHADLMLYPTRIVFEKNQRAAQIELINNGSKPATYRISLVNRRMTETASSNRQIPPRRASASPPTCCAFRRARSRSSREPRRPCA